MISRLFQIPEGFIVNLGALLNALPGAVAQGLIWGIMSIGVYITYKVLDLADLTVDGSMATGGAVCVMLMLNGCNVWLALLCAVIAGMLAGLLTGIFHTQFGIPPILAGILTQLSLYSLNLAIMDFKANQGINVTKYQLIVSQRNVRTFDLSNPIVITLLFLVVLIGILYWFFGTETGCSLRATGANEAMSRAQGINTKKTKILGLMISNGIVALSSAMLAHYQGFVDVNMGRGAIVIGLAAVIISEVLFGKLFRFCAETACGRHRSRPVFHRDPDCSLARPEHKPAETALCSDCCGLPRHSFLESQSDRKASA